MDKNRQWFKSKFGLSVSETPRDLAFCQYTIMDNVILEVEDATKDERFRENNLVTSDPNIRFYAGCPLIDPNGFALGTLCVIDRVPKVLNPNQKRALELLAQEVMILIVERRQKQELKNFEKIFQDEIKLRKKVELEVKTQFEDIEYILNESLDMISTVNENGEFVRVSKASEMILGYTPAELLGKKYIDFVHPEDLEATYKWHALLYSGNSTNDFLNRYLRKDGKWVYLSWKASFSPDKRLSYSIARDVSHRIKNEQLKENLNKELFKTIEKLKEKDKTIEKIKEFKFLADSIPQIVWTSRPDGYLDYYNQHWIEYTGMTIEETQGWGWEPVLHPDDLQQCIDVWTESITTGKPYEIEYRFKRASDGIYRWHLGRAHPMRNDQGEIVKWFGSCTDIDAYKRALDLENKIGQFEDFNRIVAHNLRGPAGSIDMIIGMLAEAESEEERKEMIGMLKSTSVSLNTTLNELMQVLEVRFNKNMTYDNCNLQELVEETENMMRGQMISRQAIITTNFEVPNIEFPLIYMKSIFYNMISNSLKYSHADVPALIGVSTKKHFGKTVLEFTDNGLGIDLQKHGKNMFKLNKVFHSGFDSKGVGLFMTKTQIETFGGTISAESEPGNGTTFIITL